MTKDEVTKLMEQLSSIKAQLDSEPTSEVVETTAVTVLETAPLLKLDMGAGQNTAEGFKGVDLRKGTDFQFDLCSGERYPFEDNSVDELRATHFIEHIKADYIKTYTGEYQDALIFFFDECWRIAKHGALFYLQWPALKSVRAFQDPTHRRFIPSEVTLYLNPEWRKLNKLDHYGAICNWEASVVPLRPEVESTYPDEVQRNRYQERWEVTHDFACQLKAIKQSPAP